MKHGVAAPCKVQGATSEAEAEGRPAGGHWSWWGTQPCSLRTTSNRVSAAPWPWRRQADGRCSRGDLEPSRRGRFQCPPKECARSRVGWCEVLGWIIGSFAFPTHPRAQVMSRQCWISEHSASVCGYHRAGPGGWWVQGTNRMAARALEQTETVYHSRDTSRQRV